MADSVHVEMLLAGIPAWNRWRKDNPRIVPDLSNLDFTALVAQPSKERQRNPASTRELPLKGANFSGASFENSVLSCIDLSNANFDHANMRGADLRSTSFKGSDLRGVDFSSADLSGSNLSNSDASGANFTAAKLISANLSRANFLGADLALVDLSNAMAKGIKFNSSQLRNRRTGLVGAQLVRGSAEFVGALLAPRSLDEGTDNYQEPQSDQSTPARPPQRSKAVTKRWSAEHAAKLREGVIVWNQWRAQNPAVVPNLEGFDFVAELKGTTFWGKPVWDEGGRDRVLLEDINLSRSILIDANFSGAALDRADLSQSKLAKANFKNASLDWSDLTGSNLAYANMDGCWLREATAGDASFAWSSMSGALLRSAYMPDAVFLGCDLTGVVADRWRQDSNPCFMPNCIFGRANLTDADFEDAVLSGSDFSFAKLTNISLISASVQGADFSGCRLSGANVSNIQYTRKEMRGKCQGTGGISEIYGDLKFQRALKDQSFVDTLSWDLERRYYDVPLARRVEDTGSNIVVFRYFRRFFMIPAIRFLFALFGGFATVAPVAGALVGILAWLIVSQRQPPGEVFSALAQGGLQLPTELVTYIAAFGTTFAVMGGWFGQYLRFAFWSLFDYGRDWDRVLTFGVFVVGIFGWGYYLASPSHVIITSPDSSQGFWLYPWFVAAMGFATLGISDMVKPVTGLGMLLILGNVLSGWLTLGLLISVIGDAFKERGA